MTQRQAQLTQRQAQRGTAMVLVMIVLVVLAFLSAAALRISQQESATVNRRIHYETLVACTEAAQKKLWADYAQFSSTTNASPTVQIPGSTMQLAIGHFDAEDAGAGLPPRVSISFDPNSMQLLPGTVMSGGLSQNNQSNTISQAMRGQPYLIVAHCSDLTTGAEYEVELMVRFGL